EIALVVATSAPAAQDAAERLDIEYRELPAVVDSEEALRAGAPLLHDDIPGNLCFDYEYGDEKAAEEAFARAAHVARLKLESTRVAGNPIEPKSCVVAYDTATGSFDVYAPTQGMSMMRPNLAIITGTPLDRIRLHHGDVGGGFGIRSQAYPEYCALMLAARSLGKPVKWVGTRFETLVSDHHGRGITLNGELAQSLLRSEWDSFEKRRAAALKRGRLRGIGCAVFIEPSRGGAITKEEAAIKFGASGDASLFALSGASGQGHETVFPEIVAEIFGIDPGNIVLRASDPAGPALSGGGTVGSRSTASHGAALAATARE